MFSFIKNSLKKIYASVTSKLAALFNRATIDEETFKELEVLLIGADTGVKTTRHIITTLQHKLKQHTNPQGANLKNELEPILIEILEKPPLEPSISEIPIYLLVGINGSGKTTFSSKLAHYYVSRGKKVLMVAADTFRAAAPEQLQHWAQNIGAYIELGKPGQDPASVVFAGCERFKKENFDVLIIDTAGRLQNKINLMNELAKIKRTIAKQFLNTHINTLLTIDAMLGQNSFEQAKLFKESTDVSGIVLTKMDGTGKGGIVFAITHELNIPVVYISYGEKPEELKHFNATEYVHELLN